MRTLGSRWLSAAVVSAVASLAWAAPASAATTYCVPSTGPQCSGTAEPDIQSAINAAGGDSIKDTIKIAPGTYHGPFSDNNGNPIDLIGSGLATVLDSSGSDTTLAASEPTSSFSSFAVLPGNTGGTGISGFGTYTRVGVGESQASMSVTGAVLAGRFDQGFVALYDGSSTGVTLSGGTISRSSVTAGHMGLNVLAGGTAVDDLIRATASNTFGINVGGGFTASTLTAHQDTVIGPGASITGTALAVSASPPIAGIGGGDGQATLDGVVLRNFQRDLSADGVDSTCAPTYTSCSFSAKISLAYSDFNLAGEHLGVHSSITEGAGDLHNVGPHFKNPAGGDFSLTPGSPVVDRGNPKEPFPFEPTFDLPGNPRKVDGDANGTAIVDMGALELSLPLARFKEPRYAVVGKKAHFNGSASHDPASRSITGFAWRFGDGAKGTGAKPTHAYKSPGTYQVRLVVTNSVGANSLPAVQRLRVFKSRPCIVPNVRGKSLAAAGKALTAGHCKQGKVTRARSSTVTSGHVISSKPPAGHLGSPGTKVNLVVSRGP